MESTQQSMTLAGRAQTARKRRLIPPPAIWVGAIAVGLLAALFSSGVTTASAADPDGFICGYEDAMCHGEGHTAYCDSVCLATYQGCGWGICLPVSGFCRCVAD